MQFWKYLVSLAIKIVRLNGELLTNTLNTCYHIIIKADI